MSLNGINLDDPIVLLTIISLILPILIYIIAEIISLWKIKEEKKEKMFNWVHNELVINIYIPLSAWSQSMSEILLWKYMENGYNEHLFFYSLSKLMKYRYKNRQIVGNDIFYTQSISSNKYLTDLLDSIIEEINKIYYGNDFDYDKIEKQFIALQFLSLIGECENYIDFILLLKGEPLTKKSLLYKSEMLRDKLYSVDLMDRWSSQVDFYLRSVSTFFDTNLESKCRKVKLYSYCHLFSTLMSFEIYKMYDSWYEEGKSNSRRDEFHDHICYIKNLIKEIDEDYKTYMQLLPEGMTDVPETYMQPGNLEQLIKNIEVKIKQTSDSSKKRDLMIEMNIMRGQIIKNNLIEKIERIYYGISMSQESLSP